MDKSKNNYKYIIAVSSFILMAVAFSIVNSVNTNTYSTSNKCKKL